MHVSPQETVSETPPSPESPTLPISPPTPSRRVPPTLQQEKQFLSPQISPPPKPPPRGTFPHKIPKLPPRARPERDDRPPPSPVGPMHQRHNSVPVHKS